MFFGNEMGLVHNIVYKAMVMVMVMVFIYRISYMIYSNAVYMCKGEIGHQHIQAQQAAAISPLATSPNPPMP